MSPQTTAGRHVIQFEDRTMSHGRPSGPLLGVLPLARWIPQDVHSMMDYANALFAGSGAFTTDDPSARAVSLVLGVSDALTSSMTDYRLSVAKIIPIRTHEAIDHIWGLTAIAAPFVFGYWKTSPRVALTHVIAGASNILMSLVTDYRAFKDRQSKRASEASAR
jgi:hypothetical protein